MMNTPIAETIGGVTSADRIIALSRDFPGIVLRTSAKAAGTPTKVASSDARTPTLTVTQNALSHSGSFSIFRYHCSENPGGGKFRYVAELNEIVTTTITGNSR